MKKRSWTRFALEYGAVAALIAFLSLLFAPSINSRGPSKRSGCVNNLKQIGLALHNYADTFGGLPPAWTTDSAGRRLHSWRTLILPYLDQQELYDRVRLNEPWDSFHNAEVFGKSLAAYRCPLHPADPPHASYVAVVGVGTAWPPPPGRVALADIKDDHAFTILVVEVTHPQFHWAEPRDLELATAAFDPRAERVGSQHPGVFEVLFADGAVRSLSSDTAPQKLRAMLTIAGGEKIDK